MTLGVLDGATRFGWTSLNPFRCLYAITPRRSHPRSASPIDSPTKKDRSGGQAGTQHRPGLVMSEGLGRPHPGGIGCRRVPSGAVGSSLVSTPICSNRAVSLSMQHSPVPGENGLLPAFPVSDFRAPESSRVEIRETGYGEWRGSQADPACGHPGTLASCL